MSPIPAGPLHPEGKTLATLEIQGRSWAVEALLFDKDGTLFDFAALWGGWASGLLERVVADFTQAGDVATLGTWIGWDAGGRRHDPAGPLAAGSVTEVLAAVTTALYRAGVPWHDAKASVVRARREVESARSWSAALRPVAGAAELLEQAVAAGAGVGVVTADDTASARMHLEVAGLARAVAAVVGDDVVSAGKPDPEPVEAVCRALGSSPARVALFGDTASDVVAARRAGVGVVVGVAASEAAAELLSGADVVVADFAGIRLG